MKKTVDIIKEKTGNSDDIIVRSLYILDTKIDIIYNEVLSSSSVINEFVLKPLSLIKITNEVKEDVFNLVHDSLTAGNVKLLKDLDEAIDKLYVGFSIVIINDKYIGIETRSQVDRGINTTDSEVSITGPKDAFNENFNTNLGLIRRRIRSKDLYLKTLFIGKQTQTKVGICYMNNICSDKLVEEMYQKLKKINIDGIIDSGYIKKMLIKKDPLFPIINNTERPDLASIALLEGKIVIIVDNSPYALIIPSFFVDFLHTPDDYYDKNINTTFIRIIRMLAFLIAVFLPSFYVSITTHNSNSISYSLLVNFASQRTTVPFPAFIEALILIISFEILRESDVRIPSKMGTSISILGGLVLGDAAVSAGIISPIMIIVIAISAISGLTFTSTSLIYTIRYFRIILLLIATFFGLYGVFIGLLLLVIKLSSITSFGYPYMAPISPYIKEEIGDSIIKTNKRKIIKRNPMLAKKNITRGVSNENK